MKRKLLFTGMLVMLVLSILGITAYAADVDSISIGDPTSVGNYYFDATFTCDVTTETAENGYSCAIEYGVDPTLEKTQGRMFNGTHNESGSGLVYYDSFSGFVPGQTIYYRAVMLAQGMPGAIVTDDVIHQVMLTEGFNGFTELALYGTQDLSTQGTSRYYFTADHDDLYVFQIDGRLQSVSLKLEDGRSFGGPPQDQYLYTVNLHAGESAFLFISNYSGGESELIVKDSSVLPSAFIGTQHMVSNSAYSFVAPESGEYSFSIDSLDYDLQYLDDNFNWVLTGSGFNMNLLEEQEIWLFSSYSPMSSVNLTVEKTSQTSTDDSIEVIDATYLAHNRIDLALQISVTDEIASAGYRYGFSLCLNEEYSASPNQGFIDRFLEEGIFYEPHALDSISATFYHRGGLVPGVTYYAQGILCDENENLIYRGQSFAFTMPFELDAYNLIGVGETAVAHESLSYLRFEPVQTGFYSLTTDNKVLFASIYNSAGKKVEDAYTADYSNINEKALTFYAPAGETMFICVTSYPEGTVTLSNYDDYVHSLSINVPLEVGNEEIVKFVAPSDGNYRIYYSDNSNDSFKVLNEDGSRTWVEQSIERYFAAGESLFLKTYDQGNGLKSVLAEITNPPVSENSIEVVDATHVAYDQVDFSLLISVTDETAHSGYGYGFEISNDPSFTGDESVWRMTTGDWAEDGTHNELHNNDMITYQWNSGLLVPNVTYYVRGLLYDNRDNMNVIASGINVFSFTMPDEVTAYEPIYYGDTVTTGTTSPVSYWRFTPNTSGMYGITTDSNLTGLQIHDSTGKDVGAVYQSDWSNPTALSLAFPANAGEVYFIYPQAAWMDGSIQAGIFTLTDGASVIPALTEGLVLEITSGAIVQFTAPDDGYYVISFADGDFESNLQYLNGNGKWDPANGQSYSRIFTKDETVFVRANYHFYDGVTLKHLQVEKKSAADVNSIEVSAPMNVTNCSMDVTFTVSTTLELASHGFSPAIEFGPDQNLQQNISRKSSKRYLDPMDQQTVPTTLSQFMPGQEFFFRAILIDSSTDQVMAIGSEIYHVQFLNDLSGFTMLSLNVPFNLADTREGKFYFNPDTDGMYSIEVDGAVNSVNVQQTDGMLFGVGGQLPSVLLGFYGNVGENTFLTVTNMIQNNCNLTISDSSHLPTTGLGTTRLSSGTPISFTASEAADYSFSIDGLQASLQYLDGNGDWVHTGSGFTMNMQENEQIWLFCSFNPMMNVNLTIEKSELITRVYTCPASLKEIHEEAFAGLDVQKVILDDQIIRINARAFAECTNLRFVLIPVASVDIAPDAFENSNRVTIVAPSGGSVEQYATAYGIAFLDINA